MSDGPGKFPRNCKWGDLEYFLLLGQGIKFFFLKKMGFPQVSFFCFAKKVNESPEVSKGVFNVLCYLQFSKNTKFRIVLNHF